jgi:hypothetical protein
MITMSLWGALGLIALGASVAEYYNIQAWRRYKAGLLDGQKANMGYKR